MVIKHKPNSKHTNVTLICLKNYCPPFCVTMFSLIKEMVQEFEHFCSLLGIFIFGLEGKEKNLK